MNQKMRPLLWLAFLLFFIMPVSTVRAEESRTVKDGQNAAQSEEIVGDHKTRAFDAAARGGSVSGISIVTEPEDTKYYGDTDEIIFSGMELTISYADGTSSTVTCTDEEWYDENDDYVAGISVSYAGTYDGDYYAIGSQPVDVEYEGYTDSFSIDVIEVTGLEVIRGASATTFYGERDDISLEGLSFNVHYGDGTSGTLTRNEVGWTDQNGQYPNVTFRYSCGGWNASKQCFAYGTWPVTISFGKQNYGYQVTFQPYTIVNGGNLAVDTTINITLAMPNKYKYTITPAVTALYQFDGILGDNRIEYGILSGGVYCDFISSGSFILMAGHSYTLEVNAVRVDAANPLVHVLIKKVQNLTVEPLVENGNKLFSFSGENLRALSSFTPSASGVYRIYSSGASEDLDPYFYLYDNGMVNMLCSNDDFNSSMGLSVHEYNFGMDLYLNKGQTYLFPIAVRNGNMGMLNVYVMQTGSDHTHSFTYEVLEPSTCAAEGCRKGTCQICKIESYSYLARTAHTFGAYKVVRAATAQQAGLKTRTCSVCGTTENAAIPKLGEAVQKPGNNSNSEIKKLEEEMRRTFARIMTTVKVKVSKGKFKISWKKIPAAQKYYVYYKSSSKGKFKKLKTTSGTSTTLKKVKKYGNYYFKVKASTVVGGKTVYSKYSMVVKKKSLVAPPAPRLHYPASIKGDVLTLKWSKLSGVSGFVVYRQVNDGAKQKIKTLSGKKTSCQIYLSREKYHSPNRYSFCVRAYRTSGKQKVWGGYSDLIRISPK